MTSNDMSDLLETSKMITDIDLFIAEGAISFIRSLIKTAIDEDINEYRKRHSSEDEELFLPADADCITYEVVFQPFICESLVISIFRVLENAVKQYCEFYKIWCQTDIGYESAKDEGIRQKFNYLTDFMGIDLGKGGDNWRNIEAWRYVRNALVHHDGRILESWRIKKCKRVGIKFDDENHVVLDFSDCKNYLKVVSDFLTRLNSQVPQPKK